VRVAETIARVSTRHERALSVLGILSMALSSAVYARFITLPEIELFDERTMIWLTAIYNVAWWAILRPRVEQRKAALRLAQDGKMEVRG